MPSYVLVCTEETLPTGACSGVTTWVDMSTIQAINPLAEFDLEVFSLVNGAILVSFLVGHGAGRMVRWMGK